MISKNWGYTSGWSENVSFTCLTKSRALSYDLAGRDEDELADAGVGDEAELVVDAEGGGGVELGAGVGDEAELADAGVGDEAELFVDGEVGAGVGDETELGDEAELFIDGKVGVVVEPGGRNWLKPRRSSLWPSKSVETRAMTSFLFLERGEILGRIQMGREKEREKTFEI